LRTAILPATNFASKFSWILIFIGLLLSDVVALAGVILFGITVLFQLITLPVEFNASRRAIAVLEGGYLDEEELAGAKKVLTAAAMTYVVALLTSLWQMFRYLLIIFGGRRRR
ncbi:MAG: zinc metallopeptidase, partial [Clostridia bacterium]|nr:zinc metallopeptidase [Clostridia bacterium]